eukprot:TRINITY_DN12703_c0_g2_i1.p1 TRINITY_DN12703_c0_g2~~TRINITY_DN12703_c0_g2_i1.p1  ORF type:complete len:495 (+),score=274.39 TRINITY_DN12703_c0_g2_i1:59-1543(+)
MVKLKLKHEKTKHEIDVDVAAGMELMRAQIYGLTGVPIERQKIVIKGKELKDGDDLAAALPKDGLVAMLMGTAEAVPEKPKEVVQFIEDMAGGMVVNIAPPGLKNLENTCYLNACIQCLKMVPRLREKLEEVAKMPSFVPSAMSPQGVLAVLRQLYDEMDKNKSGEPCVPMLLVGLIRQVFPQFDQQQGGHYMQQDAEEFAGTMLQAASLLPGEDGDANMFQGKYEEVMKCAETDAEPAVTNYTNFKIMRCHIESDTATVEAGLEKAMLGGREKRSEVLGRDAQWTVESKLAALPEYLWVNIVRFEWRKDISKKTKKLRKIVFPMRLDVYNLCSQKLKEKMDPPRDVLKAERDAIMEKKRKEKMGITDEKEEIKTVGEAEKKEAEAAKAEATGDAVMEDADAPEDHTKPSATTNNTGYYELCGVVTHSGRDADSGHYIGWTLQDDGRWMCFDDHKVYEVNEDKIKELAGGGEANSAYLLLYRTRDAKGKVAGLY